MHDRVTLRLIDQIVGAGPEAFGAEVEDISTSWYECGVEAEIIIRITGGRQTFPYRIMEGLPVIEEQCGQSTYVRWRLYAQGGRPSGGEPDNATKKSQPDTPAVPEPSVMK